MPVFANLCGWDFLRQWPAYNIIAASLREAVLHGGKPPKKSKHKEDNSRLLT